jgi:hypothetical protein
MLYSLQYLIIKVLRRIHISRNSGQYLCIWHRKVTKHKEPCIVYDFIERENVSIAYSQSTRIQGGGTRVYPFSMSNNRFVDNFDRAL